MSGFYGGFGNLGLYGALVAYGSLELTEASPPQSFVEPITLEDAQSFLSLPDSMMQSQGAQVLAFITAAREVAEILQGRDLVQKQWDLVLDYWPRYQIGLRPRLVSVDLVQYKDSTGLVTPMLENTDFIVDAAKQPGVITPPYNSFFPTFNPWPTGSILIRFTAGVSPTSVFWKDAGVRVTIGMKQLISAWFSNRIPFGTKVEELPYFVTSLLSFGSVNRVK